MTEQANPNADAAADSVEIDPRAQTEVELNSVDEATEVSDIDALQRQLAEARQEAASHQEKFLRVRADMENYKKRIERTYADLSRSSKKDLLSRLLGIKDNLERALQYGNGAATTSGEGVLEGVRLTQYQLDQLLEREGVKTIEAQGQLFDPHLAEAIQSVRNPDVPDHTIVQVARTGYTLGDEVLRPAQVIVNVLEDES